MYECFLLERTSFTDMQRALDIWKQWKCIAITGDSFPIGILIGWTYYKLKHYKLFYLIDQIVGLLWLRKETLLSQNSRQFPELKTVSFK